ncbi:unnamed protein product [Nezara viridula]|uniref:Ionotropic glutamate receptor C-terminal domain-containing protein n=1 Tax=Nezara viridula TaxID=85310 RepID=A0A9P0EDU1_NEZVI|nr:unnamed protein product [Nezara viridula]
MGGLRGVTSGLQCVQLQTDGSPAASSLHQELVLYLPLAYMAVQAILCPWLLLHDSPSSVQRPSGKISHYFNRSTFLWVSELRGVEEKYLTFENESLKEINETTAASIFQIKKLINLPHYKQKIFTIATNNFSVYSQVAQPDENDNLKWTKGFQLMYLFLLCESVGLRPIVTKAVRWDSFYKNGTIKWHGLQSEAITGNVDAAVGGIWYRAEMVGVSDILPPWERGCFRYLIPRPKRKNFDWTLFLGVFGNWVWVLIVVSIIVVPLTLMLTTKLSLNPELERNYKSLGYTFFFVISVLVQVPQVRQDWRGVQVPIFYSWMWATMVLAAAFSGSLSAMLVIPSYEDRPKNLRDLIDRGYTYGSPYSSSGYVTIFDDDMSDVWKAWTYGRFRLSKTFEETVERMKTGKFLVTGEMVQDTFFFLGSPLPPEDLLQKFEINKQCHQNFLSGYDYVQ